MSRRRTLLLAAITCALVARLAPPAAALEDCRLLRQPDIEGRTIVFVYAGDLWRVDRSGGVATRLTTHEGIERFPKLSPDGRQIAFTAEYDGNVDAFVMPVEGGEPKRLTWHPDVDLVAEWYPDGKDILLRSRRASSIQRYDRFFRVAASGGFEQMLSLPTAGYATFAADGKHIAYVSPSYDNRTWKRYKGGNAPEIWLYDFAANRSEKMTDWPGPDEWPMWHGGTIYYCSDRGGRTANLWAYDAATKQHRQVTQFKEYDVKWPSVGRDAIVFENGGSLWVMDLPGETPKKIQVLVPDDKPAARAEYRNVAKWTHGWDLSPSGKRAVLEARGELFTVPAEKGDVRNLTNTPGARERDPSWSPDGKWIAYLSDQSGEYELWVVGADGRATARQVTKGGGTFRFRPRWSPDSKKLAFSDKTRTLWWCDVAGGKLTRVDKSEFGEIHDYTWAGDSRWIAYSRPGANNFSRIALYSVDRNQVTTVSNGMTDDFGPAFDQGRYLFFVSRRTIDLPAFQYEYAFPYAETDKLYAMTLRDTTASPVAPRSDEEDGVAAGDDAKDSKDGKDSSKSKASDKDKSTKPWVIDLAGMGARVAELEVPAGRYAGLAAAGGKLVYLALDPPDPDEDKVRAALHVYDVDKREDKTVISGIEPDVAISRDGAKALYHVDETFGIVEVAEGKKVGDGKVDAGTLMATVDPPKEWMQMFDEAWRLERDFYYDAAMGGLDWKAIGARYRQLVPYVAHRSDLNYILGELIGELSTSHTYVGGGDMPNVPHVDIGLLGADYTLDAASGRYRFQTLYRDRDWNSKVIAPLGVPGVNVKEGEFLLSVNGHPVKAPENLYAAFVGTAGKATVITVGSSANDPRPRTYTVEPVASEATLRYTAWVDGNREKVAQATGGRIAYIHVPNTAMGGIKEFTKQFYPQTDKVGIIVDERFNGGGFIPDFFVERLRRTTWAYWSTRDGDDFRTPQTSIDGPKCIIVNQYAGSGGDAFPHYFRLAGCGPIIGMRTWGGLVGISHDLPFVDGGSVTMPDFGMWDAKTGAWTIENHGVDPDIEVENTPSEMVAGHDPQLERAIQYCTQQLAANPPKKPARPKYKVQEGLDAGPATGTASRGGH
jgi:tricorn protease